MVVLLKVTSRGFGQQPVYSGEDETVVMKVTLGATEFPVSMKRPPLNIALILDKSGSMRGEKDGRGGKR